MKEPDVTDVAHLHYFLVEVTGFVDKTYTVTALDWDEARDLAHGLWKRDVPGGEIAGSTAQKHGRVSI